jgi:hypothetical protein
VRVAIVFELVINYGRAPSAADGINDLIAASRPPVAGPHRVQLHKPYARMVPDAAGEPYLEVSIVPTRVGFRVAADGHQPRLPLTAGELSELGNGLYSLLRTLTGYRAARVGWDPETFVDPVELQSEWAEELAAGALPGLVLAEDLRSNLPVHAFVPFAEDFIWIPYQGEQPSTLTVDTTRS